MKSKYTLAITACFTIFLIGCGSSSSTQQQQQQQQPQAIPGGATDSYCVNGNNQQTSSHCQQQTQQAQQLGFQPYNTSNQGTQFGGDQGGTFGSGGFGNAGGLCGCSHGTVPMLVNGVMMCGSQTTQVSQGSVLTLGMSFEKRRGHTTVDESYISFDYIEASNTDITYTNPTGNNCYNQVQVGCDYRDVYACRNITDDWGQVVPASCVPVEGTNYGQCIKQTIVR